MIESLEARFDPAPVPNWFNAFLENQQKALDDLLFGRFVMDSIDGDEPEELLIDWANLVGVESDFLGLLDKSLAEWIGQNWGQFPQVSAGRLALAWCRLADVVSFVEGLERAAAALLERFEAREEYLGALSDGPSRDALGRYLFAISHYQKDRRLAAFWWRLCDLKGTAPFYHGRYAIAGLRGLPAPDALRGGFRTDVALGLVKLGRAIEQLAADNVISDATAEEYFLAVGYHTVAACPPRSAWRQLFTGVVEGASETLGKWLRKVLPELDKPPRGAPSSSEGFGWIDAEWAGRARQLEDKLAKSPQDSLPESESLIENVREFAERSGDGKTFGWVLCTLSRGIRPHDPQRAAEWAETATNWDIAEPRTWSHWIKALEVAGEIPKALSVAWDAVERFPEDAHVCTQLVHLLMISGRLQEAEQLALDALERFPDPDYTYALLATILERLEKYSAAEAVRRKATELFSGNARWWLDLVRVLVLQRKLDKAEIEARRAVDKFPGKPYLRNILGAVLSRQNRLAESEEVLRKAWGLLGDRVTKTSLAGVIRRQGSGRLDEALRLLEEVLSSYPGDVFALTEKARILEDKGEFEEAASILEELRRRDPRFATGTPDLLTGYEAVDFALQEQRDEEPERAATEDFATSGPAEAHPPRAEEIDRNHEDFEHDATPKAPVEPEGVKPHEPQVQPTSRRDLAAASRGARAVKQHQRELLTTVSEARLLRKWARRNELTRESPSPEDLRRKAGFLLDHVLLQIPNHPVACLERANLLIESGEVEEAQRYLQNRIVQMPSALGLRQALSRANRELARKQALKFDNERYETLAKPLLQLRQRSPDFQPLVHLGRGRICYAMRDGHALRNTEAREFEHLRRYISKTPQRDGKFHAWWSEQVRTLLFLSSDLQIAVTAENVGIIEQGLEKSGPSIDALEEDFTIRMSR
jgi:tetratricopeptide (TPR) repeat protein